MYCLTLDDAKNQLAQLMARGAALAGIFFDGTGLSELLGALTPEVSRADCRATALIDEALPDTTTELLADWERVLGLPETCVPGAFSTLQQRRAMVLFKLLLIGRQDPQFYIDLAAVLGFTITITEFSAARAGVLRTGDRILDSSWLFWWQVNAPLNSITYFRASTSTAGEALAEWGNDGLECILNKYKPAHTRILFSYT